MYELIGLQKVDYVNKNNVHIMGTKLFLNYVDDKIDGLGCEEVYVGSAVSVDDLCLGDTIGLNYNKWGKVQSITKIN